MCGLFRHTTHDDRPLITLHNVYDFVAVTDALCLLTPYSFSAFFSPFLAYDLYFPCASFRIVWMYLFVLCDKIQNIYATVRCLFASNAINIFVSCLRGLLEQKAHILDTLNSMRRKIIRKIPQPFK